MKILLLALLFGCVQLHSADIYIYDINTDDYPTVKANLSYIDNFSSKEINSLKVIENGAELSSKFTCPKKEAPRPISAVLTIDVSTSMDNIINNGSSRLDVAKESAKLWVDNMDFTNGSECGLTSFAQRSFLNNDFSTNPNQLKKSIAALNTIDGTNYNAGLLDEPGGAVLLAKKAKYSYNNIIIFLTDGSSQLNYKSVKDKLADAGSRLYAIGLDLYLGQGLIDLSTQSGGVYFEKVSNAKQLDDIYKQILYLAENPSICQIEWQSIDCQNFKKAIITLNNSDSKEASYYVNSDLFPHFSFPNGNFLQFGTVNTGNSLVKEVVLKAEKTEIIINDISFQSNDFQLIHKSHSGFPITLKKDEQAIFDLKYTAKDELYLIETFEISTQSCADTRFNASAGNPDYGLKSVNINLLSPKGGELYFAKSDTIIEYDGVAKGDDVLLEFSSNAGDKWQTIENGVNNYIYNWNNLPDLYSEHCKVKASLDYGRGEDWTSRIITEKHNSLSDVQHVKIDANNNIYMAGNFREEIEFQSGVKLVGDASDRHFFIAKYNSRKQFIWAKKISSPNMSITDIDVDSDNSVIFCGWFNRNIVFDNNQSLASSGKLDGFIIKLDGDDGTIKNSGNMFETLGGVGENIIGNIAIDSENSIYLAGYTREDVGFKTDTLRSQELSRDKAVLIKIDKDFNYQKGMISVVGSDQTKQIVSIDYADNIIFYTRYERQLSFSDVNLSSFGNVSACIVKFDKDLNYLFHTSLGSDGLVGVSEIDFDSDNKVYLSGSVSRDLSINQSIDLDIDPVNRVKPIIVKFDNDLSYLAYIWFNSNNINSNFIYDMKVHNGQIYAVGEFSAKITVREEANTELASLSRIHQSFEFISDLNFNNYTLKRLSNTPISINSNNYIFGIDISYEFIIYGGKFRTTIFDDDLELNTSEYNGYIYKKTIDKLDKIKSLAWVYSSSNIKDEDLLAYEINEFGEIYTIFTYEGDITIDGVKYPHTNGNNPNSIFMKLSSKGEVLKVIPMNAHRELKLVIDGNFVGIIGGLDKETDFGNGIVLKPTDDFDIFYAYFDGKLDCIEGQVIEAPPSVKTHTIWRRELNVGRTIGIIISAEADDKIVFEQGGTVNKKSVKTLYMAAYQNGKYTTPRSFTNGFESFLGFDKHYVKSEDEVFRYEAMSIDGDMDYQSGRALIANGTFCILEGLYLSNQDLFYQSDEIKYEQMLWFGDYEGRLLLVWSDGLVTFIDELDDDGNKTNLFIIENSDENFSDFDFRNGLFAFAGFNNTNVNVTNAISGVSENVLMNKESEVLVFNSAGLDTFNIKAIKIPNSGLKTKYIRLFGDDIYLASALKGDRVEQWGINTSSKDAERDILYMKLGFKDNLIYDESDLFTIYKARPDDFVILDTIDMGKILVDNSKDSVLTTFISNNSLVPLNLKSLYFDSNDDKFYSISPRLPIVLEANSSQEFEFSFTSDIPDDFDAIIKVNTDLGELESFILGEAIELDIELTSDEIDFGECFVGGDIKLDDEFILKNTGIEALNIRKVEVVSSNTDIFSSEILISNILLNSNEELNLDLVFTPEFGGEFYSNLAVHINEFKSPKMIRLKAKAKEILDTFDIRISANKIIKSLGDNISIEIKLETDDPKALDNVSKVKCLMSINKTILAPYLRFSKGDIVGNNRVVEMIFENIDGVFITDLQYNGEVSLGNANSSIIEISDTKVYSQDDRELGNYIIEEIDGSLVIDNICQVGGERLVFDTQEAFLAPSPNPASSFLNLVFNIIEEADYSIKIKDLSDKIVWEKTFGKDKIGLQSERIDVSTWNSGIYFIEMKTETMIFTEKIQVVK